MAPSAPCPDTRRIWLGAAAPIRCGTPGNTGKSRDEANHPKLHLELNAFGSYEIRWSELRDGVWRSMRKSTKTADPEEAELALARLLLSRKDAQPGTKVGNIFDAYLEHHCRPRQLEATSRPLLRALRLVFGDMDPLAITQDDIDAYVKARCAGKHGPATFRSGNPRPPVKLQPQSAGREVAMMQAALNWGSRRLMVFGKPTFQFERPAQAPHRDLWLTEAQEKDVRATLHDASRSVQVFTLMGITYRVRRGAMLDLRFIPEEVSFISNSIDFNVPGKRSTRKRRPVVPMTPEVRADLEALFAERGHGAFVLDRLTHRDFAEHMRAIGFEWVTPHVLKHTAITLMLRGGARPEDVAAATETTVDTILKVYRHHCQVEKASIFASRRA